VELPEGAVAPVTAPAVVALPFIHVVEELDDLLGELCTACIVLPTPTNSTGHTALFFILFHIQLALDTWIFGGGRHFAEK
jgi:hypothetical protein